MELFYARHGKPIKAYADMSSRSFADERNVHLGEEGILQAQELGKSLLGKGIQKIVASPFTRTLETAEHVHAVLRQENSNISFLINPLLEEVRLAEEKRAKAFKNLRKWFLTGVAESPDAETVFDVRTRIEQVFSDLLLDPRSTLLVAHQSLGLVVQLHEAGFEKTTPVRDLQKSVKLDYCGLLQWDLLDDLRLVKMADS